MRQLLETWIGRPAKFFRVIAAKMREKYLEAARFWCYLVGRKDEGHRMRIFQRCIAVVAAAVFCVALAFGQGAKKSYTFHGKVEGVDESSKSMKVNGEKVDGWMAAMTMDYKVDNVDVLKKVKPGDQIMATVYDGDYVLHNVQVAPKGSGESKKK